MGACGFIPKGQPNPKLLHPGDPNVSFTSWYAGGKFHHRLIWTGLNCVAPCIFNYKVQSKSHTRTSLSAQHLHQVSICGEIIGE